MFDGFPEVFLPTHTTQAEQQWFAMAIVEETKLAHEYLSRRRRRCLTQMTHREIESGHDVDIAEPQLM